MNFKLQRGDHIFGTTIFTAIYERYGVVEAIGMDHKHGNNIPIYLVNVRIGADGPLMTMKHCEFSSRKIIR